MEMMTCNKASLQKVPTVLFRSHMGNQKDREICPMTEFNRLMCYFGGLLWAIRHPGKDGEIMGGINTC